jgi:hypothetical protein
MSIALSLGFLVLAAAVVVLFAMLGELTARLPTLGVQYRDPAVQEVSGARLGEGPEAWPPQLARAVGGDDPALVLVLSSACRSCEDVGVQLGELRRDGPVDRLAVVVSCGHRAAGEDFVDRHRLAEQWPCFIDEEGVWVRSVFGVQSSPTALVLREGQLVSALVFTDVAAVRAAVDRQQPQPKETVKA